MPFFGKYNKNKQKYSAHLQVQRSHIYLLKKRKRVCSFTLPRKYQYRSGNGINGFYRYGAFYGKFFNYGKHTVFGTNEIK